MWKSMHMVTTGDITPLVIVASQNIVKSYLVCVGSHPYAIGNINGTRGVISRLRHRQITLCISTTFIFQTASLDVAPRDFLL